MESVYRQERKSTRKKGQTMIQKTRVMLYVNDVEMICRFFVEKIGAEMSETIELPEEFKSIVLSISKELELGIFPKVFVQKFSPEVLGPPPSLVFFTDEFETIYENMDEPGEITDNNGVLTFNFSDPEGNYFVIGKAESSD
ncbi:glyoxalase [Enterococcus lactis]|uniref:VOC family protein n=1 Tax=Enterococcus TaxID=1350 RepID=UPI0015D6719B|nr:MULTISPECIES: VOC family protein [Enterococcus]EME5421477.1 glyoxalase [Enterococcus faecium]EME8207591.1 glyoxalase [Enterococcus faecium]EMF0369933.1 glyoxalase [Enterococcus faecium]